MSFIAVYGTLKRGFHNNRILEGARFVAKALTTTPFVMYDSGFPVLMEEGKGGPVHVEVFEIDEHQLARCDRLEGSMYTRETRQVEDADGNVFQTDIYIGDPAYWIGPSGTIRMRAFKPNDDGTYEYSGRR